MVTGRKYREIRDFMHPDATEDYSSSWDDLRNALARFGVGTHRLRRFQKFHLYSDPAIVKVVGQGDATHFVVWHPERKVVLDPWEGVLKPTEGQVEGYRIVTGLPVYRWNWARASL